jgi:hypothetical protein
MTRSNVFLLTIALMFISFASPRQTVGQTNVPAAVDKLNIVCPSDATLPERLAAKEVRRYLYLRTDKLLPIVQSGGKLPSENSLIVVGQKDRAAIKTAIGKNKRLRASVAGLQPQQYLLKTTRLGNRRAMLVIGGDSIGALYGAYRFAEHLGIRFYLHGDVIPDEKSTLRLPDVDELGKPLFNVRGIQPFHDFPEGPDWWNTDGYKAIIGQLPKLRMNFIGLHTYPEGGVGPEPTVWIGLKEDIHPDGRVKSSYQARHFTTHGGTWGYKSTDTGDYTFGAAQMYDRNDYGADYMKGMTPWPKTPEDRNELFNRMGTVLQEAFTFAHLLGIKTCVGTETPLTIPKLLKEHIEEAGKDPADPAVVQQLYEGMFERIGRTYPLDYYWFWTPENWTWQGAKDEQIQATLADLRAAIAAAEKVKAPFTLATCGWVLGPPKDRALFDNALPKEMPMSCINRNVGFAFVEPGFAQVKGRPKWAIPWLEDDPAMIIPQLWVGRMRRDAADALAYGCTGLLGIHWRTRILGPNVSALAHAAWDQSGWNPDFGKKAEPPKPKLTEGREGGNVAHFPNNPIADTEDDPIYQNVLWDVRAYRLKVPNGTYTVTLKFCEPHYGEKGKRVFGVKLQGKQVIDELDIFAKVGQNKALDYAFEDVKVTDGFVTIDFVHVVEYPCIAGIVVQGPDISRKINCGGSAYKDYSGDLPATGADSRPRDLLADEFYADWALAQFGSEVAEPIARLFTQLDAGAAAGNQQQANLPRPSTWVNGPGGIRPDERPWEQVSKQYAFVDELAQLHPRIKGAGNLERFDYWLNAFRYLRAVGQVNCTWAELNAAMKKVKAEEGEARNRLARDIALPIRRKLVAQVADVHRYLLATVTTTGAMGNVTNWQQHLIPTLLSGPGQELAGILGEALPADAMPSMQYEGPPRVIVPTVRTTLCTGEDLRLTVIILAQTRPEDAALYFRPIGKDNYNRIPLTCIARSVYSVTIPADRINKADASAPLGAGLEYYVKVGLADDEQLVFPAAAPDINQTVVVLAKTD